MQLRIESLTHSFPNQPKLFHNLNYEFNAGELNGLVGPSGSGKSTLMAILSGMRKPQSGTVTQKNIRQIGWIPQNPIGVPRRTALDHVVFPQLLQKVERGKAEQIGHELLKKFDLSNVSGREFRHLSGGEAQRLCFARAAATEFDVLLVDEPTAQLDPTTAQTVRKVIRELISPHRIVVLATHDSILREQCDGLLDLGAQQ
ncbi:ATP-binding cassette domain-containing protein [Timonella sp. A28]|uniref:ATP-binding cassette domain-containing protein n=1 Tax=Timonella sp. A28 TaxID=3442640 RepID=UPI003EB76662